METSGTNGGAQGIGSGGSKIKQQRTDKNGKVVTRWVLANQADNSKKRSAAAGDRGMPKIRKPNEGKDVRKRKDRNSNGNAKRSEINRQRDEKAAIELVSSAQAKQDPNGAVKNLFESSMPESTSVEVDGRNVSIKLGSGADVKIILDSNQDSGFSIDEDSSKALDEELTSSDQEGVEVVVAELNAIANLIESTGDSLNKLIDETASDVELEGLTDQAKEAINSIDQEQAKESLDKSNDLNTIKSFIEDDIKGAKVTSISENHVSIKRDSFTLKMEVSKTEDGSGLRISDATNKKMSEMAAKIKSGEGDTKALKEEFNKVIQLTQEVSDHFEENSDLYSERMFDKKAKREEEKKKKEEEKAKEKEKKEKEKAEEKEKKAEENSKQKAEDNIKSDKQKASELSEMYNSMLTNDLESYAEFSNALANIGISGRLTGQNLSKEDQDKVDRAYKEAQESRRIGQKEKYTSKESYYKLRSSVNKKDVVTINNNTPSSMKNKVASVVNGALNSKSQSDFSKGPGGKAFETMNNNEKEFLAGMINRIAQMRYGAASEVFKDSQVKVKEEK